VLAVFVALFPDHFLHCPAYISLVFFHAFRVHRVFLFRRFVLWLMAVLMSYFIMLWSELLSSSLIFQSDILLSTLLVTSVKFILFLPVRLSKVVFALGSFFMCSYLLIMYSSRCFPQLFVVVWCHDVDLALLPIAMIAPTLF